MSDSYGASVSPSSSGAAGDDTSTLDTAKQEAADLSRTAADQAGNVLSTTKDEAASVIGEAKTQAKDLYSQSMRELKDQADTQQQRLSSGLQSVGDELGSMARNSEGSGVASDLVGQASARISAAAAWLGDRDPNAVLTEARNFARRRPGAFILGALVAGIAVGRLTRALAANASDEKDAAPAASAPTGAASVGAASASTPVVPVAPAEQTPVESFDTPIYSQAGVGNAGGRTTEETDGRADAF